MGVEGRMKECYKGGRGPLMFCNTDNAAIENDFNFIFELITVGTEDALSGLQGAEPSSPATHSLRCL